MKIAVVGTGYVGLYNAMLFYGVWFKGNYLCALIERYAIFLNPRW